mgnify:CR=1 FL=1
MSGKKEPLSRKQHILRILFFFLIIGWMVYKCITLGFTQDLTFFRLKGIRIPIPHWVFSSFCVVLGLLSLYYILLSLKALFSKNKDSQGESL